MGDFEWKGAISFIRSEVFVKPDHRNSELSVFLPDKSAVYGWVEGWVVIHLELAVEFEAACTSHGLAP
jgi:hypothetical protein